MRAQIRSEIESIKPFDELERQHLLNTLTWLDSGAELYRLKKPDVPPKHLVSYFVLIEGESLLLVDHINAELWLPTGGHVDPGEHPRTTVFREAEEELGVAADFVCETPLFLTEAVTVGKTAGHVDVSLWYLLRGRRSQRFHFDQSEFKTVRWFHRDEIPLDRTDPHMSRFVEKLYR